MFRLHFILFFCFLHNLPFILSSYMRNRLLKTLRGERNHALCLISQIQNRYQNFKYLFLLTPGQSNQISYQHIKFNNNCFYLQLCSKTIFLSVKSSSLLIASSLINVTSSILPINHPRSID